MVWMPKMLKEELKEMFDARAKEEGMPDLLDKIADETVATTEEEIVAYSQKTGHPALTMPPLM